MKLVVAAVSPTPILWRRASALESPPEVPASTVPALGMAPLRANMASRRVVLPLWKGPTSAMHRGPRGLLASCPIAASLSRDRPVIGSAAQSSQGYCRLASGKNVARVPDALQRSSRCCAEPGPYQTPALVTAPALQRTASPVLRHSAPQ